MCVNWLNQTAALGLDGTGLPSSSLAELLQPVFQFPHPQKYPDLSMRWMRRRNPNSGCLHWLQACVLSSSGGFAPPGARSTGLPSTSRKFFLHASFEQPKNEPNLPSMRLSAEPQPRRARTR